MLTANSRPTLSLDGEWSFHFDPETPAMTAISGTITVPACWESIFPELMNKAGTGIYQRTFALPQTFQNKRTFLCFDAADYFTEVAVNGEFVGDHEGGYIPFEFDITEHLRDGENTVIVRITDATDKEDATLPNGSVLKFPEIPHGKQSWYTSVGGLWQSVRLEARSAAFLKNAHFLPDIDAQTVHAKIQAYNAEGCDVQVTFTAPQEAGTPEPLHAALTQNAVDAVHPIPNPMFWSPEQPALYSARVTLSKDGNVLDAVTVRFGMRKVETRDGYICLNNRPYFIIGALDQAFYPKTRYTPPSEDYLRDQFLKAKHMGLNLMRCHIKVPTESYLRLCDEIGLLVWYELPNGKELTPHFRAAAQQTLASMWERDASHPCIIIVTIMNESWGIDLTDADQRNWLKTMYGWAKQEFSQWLVVDNSPCLPNYHVQGDLDDYHIYFNIPDHAARYTAWLTKFAHRKAGTWSTYGEAVKTRKEPLLISEFGNWGLPRYDNLVAFEGEDPYWLTVRNDVTRADGFLARFTEQKLERAFSDYNALADASQEQEWIALKFEIEQMRLLPEIGGYVITEFSDIDWEPNGLLDMGRNPKVFHNRLIDIQAQNILLAMPASRSALASGETRKIAVHYSQFAEVSWENALLEWKSEDFPTLSGEIRVSEGQVASYPTNHLLAEIVLNAPLVEHSTKTTLHFTLRSQDGTVLAHNTENLVVVPADITAKSPVTFWLDNPAPAVRMDAYNAVEFLELPVEIEGLEERLGDCGYRNTESAESADICITTRWQDDVVNWVQNGGKAILVITDRTSLTAESGLGFGVQDRRRSSWGGDWCTTKTWFIPELFPSLPDTLRFDFECEKITPRYVVTQVQKEDVVSGMFVGWLNMPAATVARLAIGKGELLITTFNLLPHIGSDPIATLLLHDLVALLRSEK